MKREINAKTHPVATETDKPPREKRKLSLKFGGASDANAGRGR